MDTPNRPDGPPDSLKSTLDRARHLQELDETERETFFAERDPSDPSVPGENRHWIRLLRGLFPAENGAGVRLDRLVPLVMGTGRSRDRALEDLVPFVELPSVQVSWSDWKNVENRRELRMRLEILERTGILREELIPFLDFFFRASDPSLYQAAALAVGKHLPEHPNLRELVTQYARDREVELGKPIVLNDRRSRRRLLLVMASLRKNHPERNRPGGEILPPSGPVLADAGEVDPETFARKILPAEGSDRGIVLRYLATLLTGADPGETALELTMPVLEETVGTFRGDADHDLVAHWNELFRTAARTRGEDRVPFDSTDLENVWSRAHDHALDSVGTAENFQSGYRALNGWDTLLRTAVRSPDPLAEKLLHESESALPEGDREIQQFRTGTWLERENRFLNPDGSAEPSAPTGTDRSPLEVLSRGVSRNEPGRITRPGEDEIFAALREVSEHFRSRSNWRAQTPRNRVLRFFVVIDFLLRTDLPEDVLEAAFDESSGPESSRGDREGLPRTAVRLVRNVLRWENPGVESFLHADLIHEIGDLELLLALLPSNREGPLLPVLADAFEHQFRLELNRNSDLDVSRYLLLITVRDPHPGFYRELARVTEFREYEVGGESISLHDRIRSIHDQVTRAGDLARNPSRDALAEFPRSLFPEGEHAFGLAERISELRGNLLAAGEAPDDPRAVIEQLLDVLGGSPSDEGTGDGSVIGLLEGLYEPDDRVLQSGFPAYRRETFDAYRSTFRDRAESLGNELKSLDPKTLIGAGNPDLPANSVREVLEDLSANLLPAVPNVEEALIEGCLEVIRSALREWVQSHRVTAERLEDLYHREEPSTEDYEETLRLPEGDSPSGEETKVYLFEHLLALIREADETEHHNLSPSEREFAAATDDIADQVDLIRAGVRHLEPGEDVLRDALSDAWRQLTQLFMDRGDVPATLELLRSEDYGSIRNLPENRDLLETAREWALNRYRLGLSYNLSRQLDEGGRVASFPREVWRFVSHYSPVWLALLVGAILMLDFGDPWTAMAREGDTRGIGLTFGVGVASTFLYILADLRSKGRRSGRSSVLAFWGERLLRSLAFLSVCLAYTFLVVGILWYLLSGTGEVLRGPEAVAHVVVWAGFSLFAGVFMGLLAQNN